MGLKKGTQEGGQFYDTYEPLDFGFVSTLGFRA
jgi:hypothetical protein